MNSKFFICLTLVFSGFAAFGLDKKDSSPATPEYTYKAQDVDFWEKVQAALNDKNFTKVISLAQSQYEDTKKDSLENAEARVAAGIALSQLGFYFGATHIFSDVIKDKIGTGVAVKALDGLEEVVRKAPVDEDFVLGETVNDIEFETLPQHLASFVGFQQGIFNLARGYNKWSENDFAKVIPESYWDFDMRYLISLGEVARNRNDSAIERLSAISSNENTPPEIKERATHNLARLIFEKGDYPRAYKILKEVKLNPREKGLILLERAWAKYYEKDYSKSLGLLAALDAPLFDPSRAPEMYILKMIIYNELCHYDASAQTFRDFQSRFDESLKSIRKRKDIRKDQQIVNLSVLDYRLQKWVNFLNSLKEEKELLNEYSWGSTFFYENIRTAYDYKIKEVNDRLDWALTPKTREVAEKLLDSEDQLIFLDYQARLDSLRVTSLKSENDYKPEEIPHLTFDKIYWISTGEYWLDELEDLKVFAESKCSEGKR